MQINKMIINRFEEEKKKGSAISAFSKMLYAELNIIMDYHSYLITTGVHYLNEQEVVALSNELRER